MIDTGALMKIDFDVLRLALSVYSTQSLLTPIDPPKYSVEVTGKVSRLSASIVLTHVLVGLPPKRFEV